MRSAILITAATLLLSMALVACNKEPAHTAAMQAPVAADDAAAAAPAVTAAPAPGASATAALPNGFVIPFEHTVVRDRTVALDDGKQQRRIQIEVSGDVAAIEKQMDAALATAGYKAGNPKVSGTKRSVNYRRNGVVELLVVTDSSIPEKKKAANATGTMRLGWNL